MQKDSKFPNVKKQITKTRRTTTKKYAKTALKLEFDCRHFPLVPFYCFKGEASHEPEFTECCYTRVHCKSSINDNITMVEAAVRRFFKKGVRKNFAIFTRKHLG